MQIKTGFHAIEEYLKSTEHLLKTKPDAARGIEILYSKAGPRVRFWNARALCTFRARKRTTHTLIRLRRT